MAHRVTVSRRPGDPDRVVACTTGNRAIRAEGARKKQQHEGCAADTRKNSRAGIIGYQFVKGDDGVALVQYVAARTSGGVSSNTQNLPPQVLQILPTRIRAPGRKTMLFLKQLIREIDIGLAI